MWLASTEPRQDIDGFRVEEVVAVTQEEVESDITEYCQQGTGMTKTSVKRFLILLALELEFFLG